MRRCQEMGEAQAVGCAKGPDDIRILQTADDDLGKKLRANLLLLARGATDGWTERPGGRMPIRLGDRSFRHRVSLQGAQPVCAESQHIPCHV
jgi:hypothetical protein